MPLYSFSGEPRRGPFWKLILEGGKTMTTRKQRRFPAFEGQTAHLYWKSSTPASEKPIHLIGRARITSVGHYSNMKSLLLALGVNGCLRYIRQEGFTGLSELVEWWTGEGPGTCAIMEGGLLMSQDAWDRLEMSGPVETVEWAYPLLEAAKVE